MERIILLWDDLEDWLGLALRVVPGARRLLK
jgi:hypothetical protein